MKVPCKNISSYSDLSFDTIDQLPSEEQVICLLKQIRYLLIKIANSVAPAIDITKVQKVSSEKLQRIYKASSDKVIEIQNISHLTDHPNDLVIQPSSRTKDKTPLGLVVRPAQMIRLFVGAGNSVFARFAEAENYIVVSEIL